MIDINGAVPNIMTKLKKLPLGHGLVLLTFKRDRGLRIFRTEEDAFRAEEFGFRAETHEADLKGMKRLLKSVLKREFPRSNKIRVNEVKPD